MFCQTPPFRKILSLVVLSLSSLGAMAQAIDPPLATVRLNKTEVIGTTYFNKQISLLEKQSGKKIDQETRKVLLQSLIDEKLVLQAAEKENIRVSRDEAVQFAIQMQTQQTGNAMTEAQLLDYIDKNTPISSKDFIQKMQDQLIWQRYLQKEAVARKGSAAPKVTEKEIQDFYKAQATTFVNPDLVLFKHIFYQTQNLSPTEKEAKKKKAEATLAELKKKEATFEEKALSDSEDTLSKDKGGEVGYVAESEAVIVQTFGQPFVDTLFSLKVGELSDIVTSLVGYHIITVEKKVPRKFLSLDDTIRPDQTVTVKEYIRNGLLQEKEQKAVQAVAEGIVADLREKSDVKILSEEYKS